MAYNTKLDLTHQAQLQRPVGSLPTGSNGTAYLYIKSSDEDLYYNDPNGVERNVFLFIDDNNCIISNNKKHTISNSKDCFIIGQNNTISDADYSSILGGIQNQIDGEDGTVRNSAIIGTSGVTATQSQTTFMELMNLKVVEDVPPDPSIGTIYFDGSKLHILTENGWKGIAYD